MIHEHTLTRKLTKMYICKHNYYFRHHTHISHALHTHITHITLSLYTHRTHMSRTSQTPRIQTQFTHTLHTLHKNITHTSHHTLHNHAYTYTHAYMVQMVRGIMVCCLMQSKYLCTYELICCVNFPVSLSVYVYSPFYPINTGQNFNFFSLAHMHSVI